MRYSSDHKAQTRLKVVRTAAQGFRREGIDSLSVSALMSKAGLTHGGFYSHFESKDDLVKEAIEFAFADAQSHLWAALEQAPSGQGTLAVVERYLSLDHLRAPDSGCPLAALGTELTRQPDEVRAAASRGVASLCAVLEQAIRNDGLPLTTETLVSMLVGAMVIARLMADQGDANRWRQLVLGSLAPLIRHNHSPI